MMEGARVSQIKTKTISRGLKGLLVAAVASAAMIAMATPASAASLYLDKGEMFHPTTVNIDGHNYNENAYAGPILFTANNGSSASANTFQFLGFCVDIFDTINVGINSPGAVNLAYHTGTLTDNGAHTPSQLNSISPTELTQINKLVTFGTNLWNTDALTDPNHNFSSTLIDQLAAVQGAIWKIENPSFDIDGSSAVDNLIDSYTKTTFLNGLSSGDVTVIFSDDQHPEHQAFAFVTPGGVPEPTTWAMMIMGLGGIGALLRRRRPVLAFA